MLLTLIGRLLQFVIMFASVKIMTSILTPEEMGKYSLVMTTTAMFAMLLINPVGMYINRRLHEWVERGLFRQVFHHFLIYIVFVALAITMFAWGYGLRDYFEIQWPWWMLAVLVGGSIVFNSVNQTLVPSLNMVGRVSAFSVLTVLTLLCSLMLSIALTRWVEASAQYWLLGTLLGQIFFSGIAYAVFFKGPKTVARFSWPTVERQKIRGLLRFSLPVAISAVTTWALAQGYRYVLAQKFGVEDLGFFAAGYGLAASLMAALELVLCTWFQPAFYQQANSKKAEVRNNAWVRYAQMIFMGSLLGALGLAFVAQEVTPIFLGQQFHEVSEFVVIGAFAEWVRVQVGTFNLIEHSNMTTSRLIFPSVAGVVVAYVGMFLLFPHLALIAAPVGASLGGGFTVILVSLGNLKAECRMRFSGRIIWPVFLSIVLLVALNYLLKPYLLELGAWAKYVWIALVTSILGLSVLWLFKINSTLNRHFGWALSSGGLGGDQ